MSIIDKISSGVSETGNNLSQKAKVLAEQNRLNSEIAKREPRKREYFEKIGEMYYMSVKKGTSPDFSKLVAELDSIFEDIEELQKQLRKLRGVAQCQRCKAEIPQGSMFCPHCGMEQERPGVCPYCGAMLEEAAMFCVECGNRVGDMKET